jgi:hypothetical protein
MLSPCRPCLDSPLKYEEENRKGRKGREDSEEFALLLALLAVAFPGSSTEL